MCPATTSFSSEKIHAYLDRIRYNGATDPTAETLAALYAAHLVTVPFENLDFVPLGRPLQLDPASLFEKIVRQRRGGYCYELNGLLAAVLSDLGYDVTVAAARFVNDDGSLGPALDHMTLIVQPPGRDDRYLVDAAGGRDASLRPLHLADGAIDAQPTNRRRFRITGNDAQWQLDQQRDGEAWAPVYVFDAVPRTLADFQERSTYHEFDPESHFRQGPICTISTPDGRITLSGNRLIITTGETRTERPVSEADLDDLLARYFGITLDRTASEIESFASAQSA